ncbi:MAG TPA: ATP-dependent zinc metalloprotease FtsH [Candidatus Negativibacillus faecipullorum]|nr:ATP-dependent zinc metalloprotease FtsH [Candidatus Negativibacillus faecipullorum]
MYLAMFGLLIVLLFAMMSMDQPVSNLKYYQVLDYFRNGEVEEYQIDYNDGTLTLKLEGQDQLVDYQLASITQFNQDIQPYIDQYEQTNDTTFKRNYLPAQETSLLVSLLPTLLLLGGMALLWVFMMRQAGGGSGKMNTFGKAKPKPLDDGRRVTFADVAGADEEKEELVEVVEFLKDPKKFNSLGARIPKGVLLMGPPGTGKTLLARAVAGEAGVPFYSISGSDFVEMFVGVGASRVRDLFDQAKKSAPSIVFIDEIDAVGRQRGAGLGGGHDEREQTLNQLLVEMDGFGANTGVIVIAATNRRDILDPALLRPGRFDRQIVVGYPDVKGREEILKVHTKNKPLGPDVDLRVIAQTTVGFTGADLENLVNEAALLAARRGRKAITMVDIEEATIKVVAGPEKKSHIVPDKDKRLTCFHEAGHAVATYYCETQDKVHEISIIPRGMAGGYTMSLPEEDRSYETRKGMQENIVTLLGGRIAEKLVLDDISTGASNDLERATKIARAMVTRYGFSDRLGPIVYGQNENEVFLGRDLGHTRDYSETVAAQIDEEIRSVIDSAYDQCEATLTEHMDQLHKVAEFLYEFEKINGADFDRLMKGDMSVFEEHRAKAGGKTTPMNPVEQPEQIASNDRQLPDDSSAETAADEAQDGADRPEPAAKPEANFPSDQSQTDDEQGPAQQ